MGYHALPHAENASVGFPGGGGGGGIIGGLGYVGAPSTHQNGGGGQGGGVGGNQQFGGTKGRMSSLVRVGWRKEEGLEARGHPAHDVSHTSPPFASPLLSLSPFHFLSSHRTSIPATIIAH